MAERMFGLETEYAFVARGPCGEPLDTRLMLERFMCQARAMMPSLPGLSSQGMFLVNGARLYVDRGYHPELATPECTNPWDVVRYVMAGEQVLADVAAELAASDAKIGEILLLKCNVDYSGSRSTWGCHESYLHRADPSDLPRQVIPHLVSRVIYTGAGGFDPRACGLVFTLSPRSAHIVRDVSQSSTDGRGIFHLKDESLCGHGYHRLHVLCGESLCSEAASWLRVGTTALVLAMIEAGLRPADSVEVSRPLDALQRIAADPACRATFAGPPWRRLGALAIQRHYLERAQEHLGDAFMPPWAPEVCTRWRAMLDRLADAPGSVAGCLDWGMKLALYRGRLERQGFGWGSLPRWNRLLNEADEMLTRKGLARGPLPAEAAARMGGLVETALIRWIPTLSNGELTWADLRRFMAARREILEADMRFGQLGPKGIFSALNECAGLLDHHVPGVDNIPHAVANPPATGRARLRGECVRRLADDRASYGCEWQGVWDRRTGRMLDLTDPFATEERWRQSGDDAAMGVGSACTRILDMLRRAGNTHT